MQELDALTTEFKGKYEKFINACDSQEAVNHWDIDTDGEMEVYYQNDIISVILKIIVADNMIREEEVWYLNANFGFDLTREEVEEIYESADEEIDAFFDDCFLNGYERLKLINDKLARYYKELFLLICQIIALSDGVIVIQEEELLNRIRKELA